MPNNLVFITMDSCRFDSFVSARTPHLDRIGSAERRYSFASWTSPSHYTSLMGQLPHASPRQVFASEVFKREYARWTERLGVGNLSFKSFIPELCLPKVLKGLCYRTVARVSMPVLNAFAGFNRSFDDYKLMSDHNDFGGMIALCARTSPVWLVDKSPGYVRKQTCLDRLLDCFPNARFVHLTRHPRGQCQSMLKARGGAMVLFLLGAIDRRRTETVLDPQILWHDAHARILGFLEKLPPWQWIHIRGEDATARFEETMTRLCRWLGLSADAALDAMRHPECSAFACIGPANARLGNDINFQMAPRLKPQRAKTLHLEPPLEWRPDQAGFHPWGASLARELGYQ